MKPIPCFLLFITAVTCLFGCGSNNNSDAGGQVVSFVDKGGVVPYPTTTAIVIGPNTIKKTESQSGKAFGEWTKQISFADYTSIRKVIADNNIAENGDVTLAPGQQSCVGWSGMTISIEDGNNAHHFDISGLVCDNQWPEGVRNLVSLRDSLVAKYFCSNPVPVSGQAFVAPRYIVSFKSGVDAVAETNRLSTVYGFYPSHVFTVFSGFAADLSPAVLEPLRCEPNIQSIEFDMLAVPAVN